MSDTCVLDTEHIFNLKCQCYIVLYLWHATIQRENDCIIKHNTSFMLWISVLIQNSLPLICSNFTPSWFTAIFLLRNAKNTLLNYCRSSTSLLAFFLLNYNTRWNHQIKWGDTYFVLLQGVFEILSLSGSFVPTENGLTKSRSGRMSVSLAGPNGRVFGGALAGLLVAAGSVQVTFVSF